MPEVTVLGTRRKGRYEEIGSMIMDVCRYAGQKGMPVQGPPAFVCHENTPEEARKANASGSAELEVVVPISRKTRGHGAIKCYTLTGGRMARIVHEGPYKDVGGAYIRLFAWVGENKLRISGPIREVYPNEPGKVPEDKLLTEIYAPVA